MREGPKFLSVIKCFVSLALALAAELLAQYVVRNASKEDGL